MVFLRSTPAFHLTSKQKIKPLTARSQPLKKKIAADGGALIEDMMFIDAGVSGATLVRPELERLRDSAAVGAVDRVYLLSPDMAITEQLSDHSTVFAFCQCIVVAVSGT